ncbi:MAG: hypothetical protein WBG50_27885, partial [Desulfomonilaceae bacterium]
RGTIGSWTCLSLLPSLFQNQEGPSMSNFTLQPQVRNYRMSQKTVYAEGCDRGSSSGSPTRAFLMTLVEGGPDRKDFFYGYSFNIADG